MTNEQILDFLNEQNYDIRRTGNGRWIDQKCAMDVVCFVADCILDYINCGGSQPFESPMIWHSHYAQENVRAVFGKPDTENFAAHDEFNRFFRQPMKMLAAAGVLSGHMDGIAIQFSVANMEVLEFIALRERNAFVFLCLYIEKVLKDSGLWLSFERFFNVETEPEYQVLKARFAEFCIRYTPINTPVEANRIFIKVLNNLACKYHKHGTERGHISSLIITFDKIAYNKPNWRDVSSGKEKNVARSDFDGSAPAGDYYLYRVNRAIKYMRQFNDTYNGGRSEVMDRLSIGVPATHVHHIFPRSTFREIADHLENLIVLQAGSICKKHTPQGIRNR